jgi:predicted DNA-binding transcriptional regulator YafY
MTSPSTELDAGQKLLVIVGDLLNGQRHSRRTIADRAGRSLATADRWIDQIDAALPRVRRVREGKTTWLVCDERREAPSKTATVGACVAASLASIFEGSQHERNLKDARDYLLKLRGLSYGDLDRKFFFAAKGGELALPDARQELDEIIDAVLESRVLGFSYRHNDGRSEELALRPLTLVIFNQQFYVLALRGDGSPYCYRFARMSNVEGRQDSFDYPSRNEFDPRAIFAPAFGIHIAIGGPVEDIEVIISGPWANFAATHRWHSSQRVSVRDDGTVSVNLQVRVCPEVESWALGFGEHAMVVRPEKLRNAVAERLRRGAARYARSGPRVAKAKPAVAVGATGPSQARSRRPAASQTESRVAPKDPRRTPVKQKTR